MPLTLFKHLDKNAFYNYEEQFIGFSIPVQEHVILITVRDQLSRIFDTEHGGALSPMHKRLKFFGCTNGPVFPDFAVDIASPTVAGASASVHYATRVLRLPRPRGDVR